MEIKKMTERKNGEKGLKIFRTLDMSVMDVKQAVKEGYSVIQTPHIGNWKPYHATFAEVGVHMITYDYNTTGKDHNFFPTLKISHEQSKRIVADNIGDILTVRATGRKYGDFLDTIHMSALHGAFPTAYIETFTEYVHLHEKIAHEVVALALEFFPHEFDGFVNARGEKTIRHISQTVRDLRERRVGILEFMDDVHDERSGVKIPNMVNIAFIAVVEALKTQHETILSLSGPDMINYTRMVTPGERARMASGKLPQTERTMEVEIAQLYEIVCEMTSFGPRLPRNLNIVMPEATHANFATTVIRAQELDNFFELYKKSHEWTEDLARERAAMFERANQMPTHTPQERRAKRETFVKLHTSDQVIALFSQKIEAKRMVIEGAEHLSGALTKNYEVGNLSQYDLIREGGLYVPKENSEKTFAELKKIREEVYKIYKDIEKYDAKNAQN